MLPLRFRDLAAAAVHLFTALGAVCALLATLAVFDGAWERMFVWLGVALVIDAVDGTFARMVNVEEQLPRFSGERLDLVVDYVTYVFVPALALIRGGFLVGTSGVVIASLILVSSLYHFSDQASKGEDYTFVGFPAIWNVVALYLFAIAPPHWFNYAALLVCIFFTFIPIRWVHPVRVEKLRLATLVVTTLWSIAAVAAVVFGFPSPFWVQAILIGAALYYVAMTVELSVRAHF